MNIDKIVIATRNPGKVQYYRYALDALKIAVVGLNDLGIDGKPKETGTTAEENAQIKAQFYSQQTKLPVFSEDESLWVDFLPKDLQPGVAVRRLNGHDEATDDEVLEYWSNIISQTPESRRTGHWHFAYCIKYQDKLSTTTRDIPIRFYYPPSAVRVPGWPLSSIQGANGKPSSEHTTEEEKQYSQQDALLIRKIIQELIEG